MSFWELFHFRNERNIISEKIVAWSCYESKQTKVSFAGSKNLTKSQAFHSIAESFLSDGVGCFVTWFRMVKTMWQNIPVDRRELQSVIAIHCWGLTVNFNGLFNLSLESVIFPCNGQGGREVKSVSRVPEVITHSSCRCSCTCNVVVLLEHYCGHFFWEIFGGKSYEAACACADIEVLRSPLPWVFHFQKEHFCQNLPFLSKMVYKRVRGWTSGRNLPGRSPQKSEPC